jgi:hypothetical protein
MNGKGGQERENKRETNAGGGTTTTTTTLSHVLLTKHPLRVLFLVPWVTNAIGGSSGFITVERAGPRRTSPQRRGTRMGRMHFQQRWKGQLQQQFQQLWKGQLQQQFQHLWKSHLQRQFKQRLKRWLRTRPCYMNSTFQHAASNRVSKLTCTSICEACCVKFNHRGFSVSKKIREKPNS